MSTTIRRPCAVLAEHGARDPQLIKIGDEVWLTLAGDRAGAVRACKLSTPSGATLSVDHRLRDAGCGERDAVALVEPRSPGLWRYIWTLPDSTIEGTFQVGRAPQHGDRGRSGRAR